MRVLVPQLVNKNLETQRLQGRTENQMRTYAHVRVRAAVGHDWGKLGKTGEAGKWGKLKRGGWAQLPVLSLETLHNYLHLILV